MKAPRQTFFEFSSRLQGFNYFSKKTGRQIFRWQLYCTGLDSDEIKQKYNAIYKDKNNE